VGKCYIVRVSTVSPAPTAPLTGSGQSPAFVTTHWSVILLAGRNDTERAREAMARLCRAYWYPLYAYVRRRGRSPHDAQDLTQAFFARLLERHSLAAADPAKGRFRSYILAAMKNFLADKWSKTQAHKRGGGTETVSLDWTSAEQRYRLEPADHAAPDKLFDRQWAVALLDAAMSRLEAEHRQEDKADTFAALRPTLIGERAAQPYAELAARFGTSEGAVKVAVHRLRKRYRALLRAEIASTVSTPEEVDAEMRHLFSSLSGM
jgi:RNA polymerase sigma factor (sigma-70 family)